MRIRPSQALLVLRGPARRAEGPLPAHPRPIRISVFLARLTERPLGLASGTCIVPFCFHYINDLLRDMGARTWRSRNRLREYLMPVDPALYAGLGAELAAQRARRATPREPAMLARNA